MNDIPVFAPAYCGRVGRFVEMTRAGRAVVAAAMRYDKRAKDVHRCEIADVNGPLRLTVPVERVTAPTTWDRVGVSTHGNWPHLHIGALEAAYGRTPYFEFYIDSLAPIIEDAPRGSVSDLATRLEAEIIRLLHLEIDYAVTRDTVDPAVIIKDCPAATEPYWQIRSDRLGFIPNLSILDLMFSLGPEAALYLRRCADAQSANR